MSVEYTEDIELYYSEGNLVTSSRLDHVSDEGRRTSTGQISSKTGYSQGYEDFFIGWPTESSSIPFNTLRHWVLGTRFLHLAFSARQSGICVAVNTTMQSADA